MTLRMPIKTTAVRAAIWTAALAFLIVLALLARPIQAQSSTTVAFSTDGKDSLTTTMTHDTVEDVPARGAIAVIILSQAQSSDVPSPSTGGPAAATVAERDDYSAIVLKPTDGPPVPPPPGTVPSSVTFVAGATEMWIKVVAADDDFVEPVETVKITFGTLPSGITSADPSVTLVNIYDNDKSLSIADSAADEGAGEVIFTITLNPAADVSTRVRYSTVAGTAEEGTDYTATSGRVEFAVGDTTKTISVPIIDDNIEDSGETFTVELTYAYPAKIADGTATGTITNDEAVAATTPGAPRNLDVSRHDTGALDMSWEAPASDGGSATTGYKVQWKEAAASWGTLADVSEAAVTGTSYTITGLTDGVGYTVRVIATNSVGDGAASAVVTATPRETTPPELATATVDGATLTAELQRGFGQGFGTGGERLHGDGRRRHARR